MACISLTTDFGLTDWFVGTMKGVIASLAPRAKVIDLTHDVPAGDIRAGAFALAAGCRFFPKGTVHVAVVDPGVGTARRAIAVRTVDYVFVGPDNGVLCRALANERVEAVHLLENRAYFLPTISRTFHGRDIFAPAAAHLSRGLSMRKLGPAVDDTVPLPWPEPRLKRGAIEGEVLYLDRFGNAITNVGAQALLGLGTGAKQVFLKHRLLCLVADGYQAVPTGEPVAVAGSSGFVEIAINQGRAADRLGLEVGSLIEVRAAKTLCHSH